MPFKTSLIRRCGLLLAASVLLAGRSLADVVIDFAGATFQSETGAPVPADRLFQLVNLGANGVFDPIQLSSLNPDGWTSGDDRLVQNVIENAAINNTDGWLRASAFDVQDGAGTAGFLDRSLAFSLGGQLNPGDKIGVRWFPTRTANNNFADTPLTEGTPYGQFTRQGVALYGGDLWIVPTDSVNADWDPLITTSNVGGLDPESAGLASNFVVIPEPGSTLLLLIGAGAMGLRRAPRGKASA